MEPDRLEMALLDADEKEMLTYIWNMIPAEDKEGMTEEDILFVLDAMDDFLEEKGLLLVDEATGEMNYQEGEIDETEQLDYLLKAVKEGVEENLCSKLSAEQVQLILDAELQYGIEKGYYNEEE